MLSIRNEPFLYRLSALRIKEEQPVLLLVLSKKAAEIVGTIESDMPIIKHFLEHEHGCFTDFHGVFEIGRPFGFNDGLAVLESEGSGVIVEIPIPVVESLGETCRSCGGTGEDDLLGEGPCISCGGRKKERLYSHESTFVLAATLCVLFTKLNYTLPVEYEGTEEGPLQLLSVETNPRLEPHGGSLGGAYSAPLVNWLSGFPKHTILETAREAVHRSWSHMHPLSADVYSGHSIRVWFSTPGFLLIDVPGDACGLHPESHNPSPGRGCRYSCHNVDTTAQQLALLTGLAGVTDLAMKEGVGQG